MVLFGVLSGLLLAVGAAGAAQESMSAWLLGAHAHEALVLFGIAAARMELAAVWMKEGANILSRVVAAFLVALVVVAVLRSVSRLTLALEALRDDLQCGETDNEDVSVIEREV